MNDLMSQRIYADKKQFKTGNGRFAFVATVFLDGDNAGYVLRDFQKIPVKLYGRQWPLGVCCDSSSL